MLENVELKPWQDLWNKNYNLECERIKQWLSNNNLSATIYHIGSTSVRGMESRPIIDILVCPSIEMSLLDVVAVLERAGYICLYEHTDPACFDMMLGDKENLTFFLRICYADSSVSKDLLLFYSILQSFYSVRGYYLELKRWLARVFSDDYNSYQAIKCLYINSICKAYKCAAYEKTTEVPEREEV